MVSCQFCEISKKTFFTEHLWTTASELRQSHRKTPVLESFFNKATDLRACSFIKKRLQHGCFPVKFAKFLRTSILKNICERLLLKISTLQKTIHRFLSQNMIFIIISITFEVLKFLLSFCAVFANLLYKNIRFSLLYEPPSSELINYYVETVLFSRK